MFDSEEGMGLLGGCCLAGGGCAGLAVGIWAAVEYLQPALEAVDGISKVGADWITAGIALFGGLELASGAGVLAGAALACCALGAGVALSSCCSSSFFSGGSSSRDSNDAGCCPSLSMV